MNKKVIKRASELVENSGRVSQIGGPKGYASFYRSPKSKEIEVGSGKNYVNIALDKTRPSVSAEIGIGEKGAGINISRSGIKGFNFKRNPLKYPTR